MKFQASASIVFLLGFVAEPAVAEESGTGLDDIVVTAERQEGNLQKTPIAVSVINGQQLRNEGILSSRDINGAIPNLIVPQTGTTTTQQQIFLRGFGEIDNSQPGAVGIYIDDVYIPRSYGALFDLIDVDQIEVLRGPQGTLYGRNTIAGAIRVQTREPSNELSGSAQLTYGSFNLVQAKGYLSGPIVEDVLSGGITVLRSTRDGYVDAPNLGLGRKVNDLDQFLTRGKLEAHVSDQLTLTLSADYLRDKSDPIYYTPVDQPGGGFDPDLTLSASPPIQDTKSYGGSANLAWTGDHVRLKSITAYRNYKSYGIMDFDGVAAQIVESERLATYRTISQEFQASADIGAFDVIGGLFFYNEKFAWVQTQFSQINLGNLPTGSAVYNTTKSYAAFGQAKYTITDALTLTAGLRYTRESETQDLTSKILDANADFVRNLFVARGKDNWSKLTPKFSLDYQATPNVLVYGSITQGFQIGGYSTRAATVATALAAARPETVWTYETGVKADLFDKTVRLNLAAFYNDQKDLVVQAYDREVQGNTRANADKAHSYGFEAEGTWQATDRLRLSGYFTYLKAAYDKFLDPFGSGTSIASRKIPYAAKYTTRIAFNYMIPIENSGKFHIGGDYNYQSSAFVDLANTIQSKRPAQGLFNANIGYTTADGGWEFLFSARNIADRRYDQIGFYNGPLGVWYRALNMPRTFSGSVRYNF